MALENFLKADLSNSSITVLEGEVIVELVDRGKNHSLSVGDTLKV